MSALAEAARAAREAYRQRWKRRGLLLRAWRARKALAPVADRTAAIRPGDVLCFATVRNEGLRLPYFLAHYRAMGVRHFLFVDNLSDDGSPAWLAREPDVSLWQTDESYRESRFGMDWMNRLLAVHGSGHWCLVLDADELLVYPDCEARELAELTRWLEARGAESLAAMMLDIYPKGRLSEARCAPGEDPVRALPCFDAGNYRAEFQQRYRNVSIRGGVRERAFFSGDPERGPHLHKLPLVRWHWRFAFLSSTHVALPRRLNRAGAEENLPSGVLLHTKFLPGVIERSVEERRRGEHFTHAGRYADYYGAILADPDLRGAETVDYAGAGQLEALGLMRRGDWGGTEAP